MYSHQQFMETHQLIWWRCKSPSSFSAIYHHWFGGTTTVWQIRHWNHISRSMCWRCRRCWAWWWSCSVSCSWTVSWPRRRNWLLSFPPTLILQYLQFQLNAKKFRNQPQTHQKLETYATDSIETWTRKRNIYLRRDLFGSSKWIWHATIHRNTTTTSQFILLMNIVIWTLWLRIWKGKLIKWLWLWLRRWWIPTTLLLMLL